MGKNILVVDDEKTIRDFLERFLRLRGFEVKTAEGTLEALELVKKQDFDFIFVEVKMKDMGGLKFFREARKLRPSAKYIFTTGSYVDQPVAQAIQEGALGCVRKPFEIGELDSLLKDI